MKSDVDYVCLTYIILYILLPTNQLHVIPTMYYDLPILAVGINMEHINIQTRKGKGRRNMWALRVSVEESMNFSTKLATKC